MFKNLQRFSVITFSKNMSSKHSKKGKKTATTQATETQKFDNEVSIYNSIIFGENSACTYG